MATMANKETYNICERCRQEFHSWPEYHEHRQIIKCSVKYVPVAGQPMRSKAELVTQLEKKLRKVILVPKDTSLHDTYLAMEARR